MKNFKFLCLAFALITVCGTCNAQSFVKSFTSPVPKVAPTGLGDSIVVSGEGNTSGTQNVIRPIASVAAYVEPGNIAMAGVGVGFQHLTWNATTQKWTCQWSINALGFAGGSVAPSTPAAVMSYGVMVGVLNNLVMVGPVLNGDGKLGVGVSIGISLNN